MPRNRTGLCSSRGSRQADGAPLASTDLRTRLSSLDMDRASALLCQVAEYLVPCVKIMNFFDGQNLLLREPSVWTGDSHVERATLLRSLTVESIYLCVDKYEFPAPVRPSPRTQEDFMHSERVCLPAIPMRTALGCLSV